MSKIKSFAPYLIVALVAAFMAVGLYAWLAPTRTTTIIEKQGVPSRLAAVYTADGAAPVDFTVAAAAATPAVVHITSTSEGRARDQSEEDDFFKQFFGPGGRGMNPHRGGMSRASGSGVILTQDGYIVTNNHVIESADKVEVVLEDNRRFVATVVGTDAATDLALVKIDVKVLPFIRYGNSDELKVGEWVLAVGNPFDLTSTVTAGIVSAKGRFLNLEHANSKYKVESFIQTDAAINPGNSGGALLNTRGELIGINTAIASPTQSYAGYAFAVPSKIVNKVVDDLLNYGEVQRGLLGIQISDVNAEVAEQKKLTVTSGVYVGSVNDNSAAKAAGLQEGDVITKLDDATVNTSAQLQEQVARHRPGDKLKVTYLRAGKEAITTATLRNQAGTLALEKRDASSNSRVLGGVIAEPSADELKAAKVNAGAKVESLTPGKLRLAGVREGFIITRISDQEVKSPADVRRILDARMAEKRSGALIEGVYPDGKQAVYAIAF